MLTAFKKMMGTYGPLTEKEKNNRSWVKGPRGTTMSNQKPGGHSRYFIGDLPQGDLSVCKAAVKLCRDYFGAGEFDMLYTAVTPEFEQQLRKQAEALEMQNRRLVIEDLQPEMSLFELNDAWQDGDRYYMILRVRWKETRYIVDTSKKKDDPERIVQGSDMRWESMDELVTFACDVNAKYPYFWKVHAMEPYTDD